MFPKSHQKELLSWLNLLKNFQNILDSHNQDFFVVMQEWTTIKNHLQTKIMTTNSSDLEINYQSLFQSWQTETYRYMRLLETDLLFYQSAKQLQTKKNRYSILKNRLQEGITLTENVLKD